jgi:tRNA1(Val) A37 N6-methylase TrmN6
VNVSEDRLLNGAVRLRQGEHGYRAGMDAALLAAACDTAPGETVIEAGCGAGAVMLSAAVRRPGVRIVGLERDPEAAALAEGNIALNGLGERLSVRVADIEHPATGVALPEFGKFDASLANPPYFDDASRLRAPALAKRGAFLAEAGLGVWIDFLSRSVREGGTLTLVHRADRLADILTLIERRAGSIQVRPIHPFADAPAGRVLVRAVRSGRAPLRLLPALTLHPREGTKHTAEAEAILRGEADLAWS